MLVGPMHHREDLPLVNFEVGPQSEEFEFLVDTRGDRSSIKELPVGVIIRKKICEVMGVEGKLSRASIIKNVEIKGNLKQCVDNFIYLPNLESNLLGRDLQVQLGLGIIPRDGRTMVPIIKLTSGDIEEINPEVWAGEGKRLSRYLTNKD